MTFCILFPLSNHNFGHFLLRIKETMADIEVRAGRDEIVWSLKIEQKEAQNRKKKIKRERTHRSVESKAQKLQEKTCTKKSQNSRAEISNRN